MSSPYTPRDVYLCDGERFVFPITFPVDSPADILVFLELADGSFRRMVRNQDYVVRTDTWEVVTRVDDYRDPWPVGVTLVILRRMLFLQPSGRAVMSVRTFQNRVDSLTRMFQQIREKLDRTLHVGQNYPPFFATTKPYALPIRETMYHPHAGAVSALFFNEIIDIAMHPHVAITGGSLQEPVIRYSDWPPEEMEHPHATVTGGNMIAPLIRYSDWPPEEMEHPHATITGGNLT